MYKFTISLLCIVVLTVASCKKASTADAFKRTGAIVQQQRMLTATVTTVAVNDAINLTTVPDSVNYLIITAGKNLFPKISTELVNGELTLKNNNTFNWVRSFKIPINIELHTTTLHQLKVLGTGNITINKNTCSTDSMRITARLTSSEVQFYGTPKVMTLDISTGTGTYILHGSSASFFVYIGAIGKIDASDFTSTYTDFTNSSIADVYLNTQGDIYGQLHSLGNVYDKGTGTLRGLTADDRGQYIKQ